MHRSQLAQDIRLSRHIDQWEGLYFAVAEDEIPTEMAEGEVLSSARAIM